MIDELSRIAYEVNCDKVTISKFTEAYDSFFRKHRNEKFNLLEIGVWNGGSMAMWEEYFPNAQIFGIDMDDRCIHSSSHRVHIHIANQANKEEMEKICDYIGELFIVCDDGSHRADDIIISLDTIYPYLSNGGYYIIEDILPECKEKVYSHIKDYNIVHKSSSAHRPEVDMVIIQKCLN